MKFEMFKFKRNLLVLTVFSISSDRALALHAVNSNQRRSSCAKIANRRDVFGAITTTAGAIIAPTIVSADESVSAVDMKNFVDPVGYFAISIPKTYFTLRRTAKGDLPDPKTGVGRRGSSIFTAGDMAKAELVAVER